MSVIRVEPLQQRIARTLATMNLAHAPTTRRERPRPQRDEHAINIDKDQRTHDTGAHAETLPGRHLS